MLGWQVMALVLQLWGRTYILLNMYNLFGSMDSVWCKVKAIMDENNGNQAESGLVSGRLEEKSQLQNINHRFSAYISAIRSKSEQEVFFLFWICLVFILYCCNQSFFPKLYCTTGGRGSGFSYVSTMPVVGLISHLRTCTKHNYGV